MDWWTINLLTMVYLLPDGCLEIVTAMVYDTPASCVRTLFIRGMIHWHNALWLGTQGTSPFVHVSRCRSEWSSKGLERKRSRVLDCLCAWAAWVWNHGSPSLFPSSFLSFSFLFYFSLYFFKQARADTFLKQGYSFGCLELCSEMLSDFPHTWIFVWKSSV